MGRMEMLRASLDNSHSEGVGEVHSWPGVGALDALSMICGSSSKSFSSTAEETC